GTGTLAGGVASFTTAALALGSHSITASYVSNNGNFAPSQSAVLLQAVNVPLDSLRLRSLQIAVTKLVAQGSGQTITRAIDTAISEGFSDGGLPISPSSNGLRFNFTDDFEQPRGDREDRAFTQRWDDILGRESKLGANGAGPNFGARDSRSDELSSYASTQPSRTEGTTAAI